MFSIRRRGLRATAALAAGTVVAGAMLAGGGLTASAAMASASTRPAPQPGHGKQHDKNKADIRLFKSASPRFYSAPGQQISYTYWVTNTGTVPLFHITLTDNRLGRITCPRATLASYKWMTCTATYTTTQRDVRTGRIDNSAVVVGRPRKGWPVTDTDSVMIVLHRQPGIQLDKVASPTQYARPGQLITYTYTVTNTGAVPLFHITLTDDKLGAITCPKSTLYPGKWMTCQGTHTTTWADVKAGQIANSATVTGRPRKGHKVSDTATAVVTAVKHPRHPAIALAKWAYPTTYGWAGQKITYAYRVTNTGNVTLRDIMVADNKIPGPIACPTSKLAPGKWMDCHAVHVTTEAEVRAGHICNVATAAGRPPRGSQVKAKAEACVVLNHHTLPIVPVTG
jgi:hypothetical protein